MSLKKYLRIQLLLFCLIVLNSCSSNYLSDLEDKVNSSVLKQIEEGGKIQIQLDSVNSFGWDEVIVAAPYTDLKRIDGYDFSSIETIALDYEKNLFFGFIKNKKGIKYMIVHNSKIMDKLWNREKKNYYIYPKSESNFVLSE